MQAPPFQAAQSLVDRIDLTVGLVVVGSHYPSQLGGLDSEGSSHLNLLHLAITGGIIRQSIGVFACAVQPPAHPPLARRADIGHQIRLFSEV
jgi:hypothetical protein